MLKTIFTTLAFVGAASVAQASTFDFDDPALQDTLVTSVTTSDGLITADLTVVANINRQNPDRDHDGFADVNAALIFNAAAGADGDPDLQFPDAGGVLVIAENDLSGGQLPDDNQNGGTITFDFVQAVNLDGFTIYDDATITVTADNGATFSASVGTDGASDSFLIGDDRFAGITSLTFDFNGESGAIDDLLVSLTQIPVPAGMPLLLAGLGAFGIAARRKKAAK